MITKYRGRESLPGIVLTLCSALLWSRALHDRHDSRPEWHCIILARQRAEPGHWHVHWTAQYVARAWCVAPKVAQSSHIADRGHVRQRQRDGVSAVRPDDRGLKARKHGVNTRSVYTLHTAVTSTPDTRGTLEQVLGIWEESGEGGTRVDGPRTTWVRDRRRRAPQSQALSAR